MNVNQKCPNLIEGGHSLIPLGVIHIKLHHPLFQGDSDDIETIKKGVMECEYCDYMEADLIPPFIE